MRYRLTATALAALLFAVAACSQEKPPAPARATESPLIRGKYLVEDVGKCADCHTPMTPKGPDMKNHLLGAKLEFTPVHPVPGWMVAAPRIAGIPHGWTKEHLITFLESGKKPGGAPAGPPMPAYRFNHEDAVAATEYLASLPAKAGS